MNTVQKQIEEYPISGEESYFEKGIELLNSYITYRKKYLVQNKDNYITAFTTLSDWNIEQHLKGKVTYGIFVNKVSKFLTFDIDMKVKGKEYERYNKWVLYKVRDVLIEEGLYKYLNISFSGSKGYHLDLVFDKPIRVQLLKDFGEYIIKKYELNNIVANGKKIAEVELRGCNAQGVKLPLGINKKSNAFMYYLDDDLKPVTQKKFLNFELKIMDSEEFYNLYSSVFKEIDEIKKLEIKNVIQAKTDNEIKPLDYDKSELDFVIQNEMLKNKGTRNDIIYLIALWCNTNKIKKEEALEKLYRIIENTPEELYHDKTSFDWKYKECQRVVEKVYVNNLVLFDIKKVKINAKILEFIMQSCKTLKQMNIMLCHIYHCLKWGNDEGIYYLSLSTIEKYTGATHKTIEKLNKQLIDLGILKEMQKGYYIDLGNGMKKGIATTYKLTIPNDLLKNSKILLSDKIDFIKVCAKHLDKNTIKKYISKQTYYDNFKSK